MPARALEVKAKVLAAEPTPPAQWTVPPAYEAQPKKKKKRGLLRRIFR
ncbi:MAG: hypothetical protein IAG13_32905 [Deltaproteobacteria bacterium]|nr:hypothetical protein [Nannocystaceae bacterium]